MKKNTIKTILCLLLSCLTSILVITIQSHNVTEAQPAPSREQLAETVASIEQGWEEQYREHLSQKFSSKVVALDEVEATLRQVTADTKSRAAFIWINAYDEHFSLVLSTGKDSEYYQVEVGRSELEEQVKQLITSLNNPYLSPKSEYLPPAQKLYEWFIRPILPSLQSQHIDSLIFCPGKGLRTFPLAALHNGKKFLIEEYAVSRVPAYAITEMKATQQGRIVKNSPVLAMGASEFDNLISLPAVPLELTTVTQEVWEGKALLNQEFTLESLVQQMKTKSFSLLHFATHAALNPGSLDNSYIQFWKQAFPLSEFQDFKAQSWWSNVELLILSACETAVINEDRNTIDERVELSFAGLAVQAGVKSVLASLWNISDQGTLGLMAQFYQELSTAPTKTIALQRAQLALLNKRVRIEGKTLSNLRSNTPLPESLLPTRQTHFSHPYYWSTFTVIGNPW